ncbi:hypothetical protein QH494_27420 [Sphingomonas sp. AR_OL41]|uniref:hypothetical protein n=1 Tax=Sphingomonas sp. AR_OL41 TaxID=3042729 RepID=UPI00247FC47F|nr:hypothetical protein [Sphingomonas sp. AR_OL41]MDH7975926.1 hypothetical protein [Sphingomonas sp. AR_OL41]
MATAMPSVVTLFIRTVVVRDWRFLVVTVAACVVATTVATVQYAVFTSFVIAGAAVPRLLAADVWISAATVQCFDFPDPMSEDYAGATRVFLPGAAFRRVVVGFATWRSPTGRRSSVAVVGVDGLDIAETGFIADTSDLSRLDLDRGPEVPREGTIGGTTLQLSGTVDALASFLGTPYVLVPFDTGRRLLRMDAGTTAYLAGNFPAGRRPDLERAQAEVVRTYPELQLLSGDRFIASSSSFWQRNTGAGAAILLAAVLAALLMVLLLANGISRFVQRHNEDLLSLIGHGASAREIARIVLGVSVLIAALALASTLVLAPTLLLVAHPLFPWTGFHAGDAVFGVLTVLLALAITVWSSRRAIAAYGPEAVFRS